MTWPRSCGSDWTTTSVPRGMQRGSGIRAGASGCGGCSVDDLAAFISARLSEDEAMAKAAAERQPYDEWDAVGAGGEDDVALSNWRVVAIAIPGLKPEHSPAARAVMRHIARHDPARVLREVAAKRAIVARYGEPFAGLGLGEQLQLSQERQGLWFAVRELAAIWSDHPDYRAEWAPGHG